MSAETTQTLEDIHTLSTSDMARFVARLADDEVRVLVLSLSRHGDGAIVQRIVAALEPPRRNTIDQPRRFAASTALELMTAALSTLIAMGVDAPH